MKAKVSSAARSRSPITPKRDDLQIGRITGWARKSLRNPPFKCHLNMNIRTGLASLLLAACYCCLGQTDTNLLATGNWSAPVSDKIYTLRGRLLIYAPEPQPDMAKKAGVWNGARVYLELQRLNYTLNEPVEIFIDRYLPMHAEMRNGDGKVIAGESGWCPGDGPIAPQFTVTLPPDATLRLHASTAVGTQKPGVLLIAVPERAWAIERGDTNEYFLSATFSPTTNHPSSVTHFLSAPFSSPTNPPSPHTYHLWQGTLHLPPVRIPLESIKEW
jgi:hypothetical protein